jgi:hypothetical protein
MKDDHKKNGQLKPTYNVQIGTENQFYTHFDFYPNPADFLTFITLNKGIKERYDKLPKKMIADSGYGSEENHEYLQINEIEAYVKYSLFHYVSHTTLYRVKNCTGCPLRCLCYQGKGNCQIEINHKLNQYRQKARELLTCEEGLLHRSRRPIEPEAVFGQTKANKQYDRFLHFDLDKVKMDLAIFAVAFNIGKLYNKTKNTSKKQRKSSLFAENTLVIVFIPIFVRKKAVSKDFYLTSQNEAA